MTTRSTIILALVIATLFAASARAADDPTQATDQQRRSTTLAKWKVGDTRCAVVDGQVRCALK